eukprot:TRINITY_DN1883_c0_g3_i1.p1 TRINITY_DN1883_c0_g3~~TRINITY_DN1883_c0_g3_i1.p1  ORF type:complete len:1218 (-),score=364.25 TRINITY_DN1883_c0_g3_i1:368-3628(-)
MGKPLAATLVPKFKELNPFCDIKAAAEATEDLVKAHSVMLVLKPMPLADMLRWNDFCRANNISFIFARTGGLFGSIFVDHGDNHVVMDPDGELPMVRLVDSIETGPDALVRLTVPDGQAPGSLPEGAYVEFSDVVGCDGLMTHQEPSPAGNLVTAWKTSTKPGDPVNTIRIGDTSQLPKYVKGGIMTEKKVSRPCPSKSLKDVLKNPGMPFMDMVGTDMVNFGSELQTHLALHAALELGSADAAAVVAKAKDLIASKASELDIDVDETMFGKFMQHYGIPLQPMCAFLGGVVAQEVVKCAGKYTPIPGFLHFNAVEALPENVPSDTAPKGCRYDNLAAVYGHSFIEKLGQLKYFMVGCGALGCEFFKNFALNGVCCGKDGLLTVTDADRIELSNLTRQFLFREHNVGQPKSRAASEMAKVMNPALQVRTLEMFVGPKTEDHFNDEFWMGLDGVCNALDNMEARFYVDDQCVKYGRSLLESGTMGPAGNVDPIVPFKTQTYRDGGQADQGGGIPMCTLRNFPHLPDHCIEWSRDQFELLFVKSSKQAKKFVEDPDTFIAEREGSTDDAQSIFEVRGLLSLLSAAENPSIKSAGQLAFDYFHFLFRDKITDLTTAFPEDARVVDPETKQDKGAFWSGHKRFPRAATFDTSNETHWQYLVAATSLFAAMLGVVPQKKEDDDQYLKEFRSQAWAKELVAQLTVTDYVAGAVNTEGDANADSAGAEKRDSKATLKALTSRLAEYKGKPLRALEEADFEKDDDLNFHIAFITHCANLRADNYYIANSAFDKVKVIAGRIIPAIATTTAAVCGLVMLELFKFALGKGTEDLRTRQVGLAVNTFTSFEANPPKMLRSGKEEKKPAAGELPEEAFDEAGNIKKEYIVIEPYGAYPDPHSVWDSVNVPSGKMTLAEFKDWLASEHKIKMKDWSFVIGWKPTEDDDGKEHKGPVATQVYPPPVQIDGSLLPPLEDDQGSAMKKIMGTAGIPPAQKMKYLSAWQTAKKTGALPAPDPDAVRQEMTLAEILNLMETKADKAMKDGGIAPKWGKAISGLAGRKFWLIPADQTPSCSTIPADDSDPLDLRYLAAFRIPLDR